MLPGGGCALCVPAVQQGKTFRGGGLVSHNCSLHGIWTPLQCGPQKVWPPSIEKLDSPVVNEDSLTLLYCTGQGFCIGKQKEFRVEKVRGRREKQFSFIICGIHNSQKFASFAKNSHVCLEARSGRVTNS